MHGAITLGWADSDNYTFRLGLKEIEELEEKTGVSIFQITQALSPAREAKLREIRETIRIGLIGGGQKPEDARKLVERYVDERPLDESRDLAYAIALAALARVHPDKAKAESKKKKPKK